MADYTVTGTCSPDVTGDYTVGADFNGIPAYYRDDAAYFLGWNPGASRYAIWSAVGPAIRFNGPSDGGVIGTYTPVKGASGSPVVAAVSPPAATVELFFGAQGKVIGTDVSKVVIGGNVVFG